MKHPHSTEIRATELPDGGVRIELPFRNGAPESFGVVLVGLSLIAGGVFLAIQAIRAALEANQPYVLALVPVGAAGLVGGGFVLRNGLFGLIGFRRTIEVSEKDLRVVEQLGRLMRSRKRPLASIRAFEIEPEKLSINPPRSNSPAFTLTAECPYGDLRLADRCPRVLLTKLADRLVEACRAVLAASGEDAPRLPVRVTEPVVPEMPSIAPIDAKVTADPKRGGVRLVVPPLGFWRGRKEPFIFAVLWLAFTTLATAGAVMGKVVAKDMSAVIGFGVFLCVFWSVGLWALSQALKMAYTRTVLTVEGVFVTATRQGPFGTSRRRFRRAQVKHIVIGPSASLPAQKGGPRIPEVQIHFKVGGYLGLLGGRHERELRWVVDALSTALDAAAEREPNPSVDVLEQPAASTAILDRTADGVTLKVPAQGFRGKRPGLGIGGVLVGTALSAGIWAMWNGIDGPWTWTWVGVGFIAVVALLCFGLALETVAFALCRRVLTVEGDEVTAASTTWWGGIQKVQYHRSELVAIDVGPPNPTGAFLILPQLRFHRRVGRTKKMMIYHDEEELLWIATLVRQALRLPPDEKA